MRSSRGGGRQRSTEQDFPPPGRMANLRCERTRRLRALGACMRGMFVLALMAPFPKRASDHLRPVIAVAPFRPRPLFGMDGGRLRDGRPSCAYLIIAAAALHHGLTVVTRNVRDYEQELATGGRPLLSNDCLAAKLLVIVVVWPNEAKQETRPGVRLRRCSNCRKA
jgi:hypothetical protein